MPPALASDRQQQFSIPALSSLPEQAGSLERDEPMAHRPTTSLLEQVIEEVMEQELGQQSTSHAGAFRSSPLRSMPLETIEETETGEGPNVSSRASVTD